MALIRCPKCGKHSPAGTTACRWCKAPFEDLPSPAERIAKEVQELAEWKGRKYLDAPPISNGTFISAGLTAASLTALVLSILLLPAGVSTTRIYAFLIFGALLALSLAALLYLGCSDILDRKIRHRRTALDAAKFYFMRISRRWYGSAAAALADHETGRMRRERLWQAWNQKEGDLGLTMGRFSVHHVTVLDDRAVGEDLAMVRAEIFLEAKGNVGVPLVASVEITKTQSRVVEKLLIRRQERWYLVNGWPEDLTDRRLLRALLKAQGRPQESPSP